MKRSLILTVSLSVAAALLFTSLGNSQTPIRGFVSKVTASTTPKRDRTRPYVFTTRGKIVPPPRYCAPGEVPNPGRNCVPIRCPAGATNPAYCTRPTRAQICSGKVNVRYQKRSTTVSSRNVTLRRDCTYRSRVTFRIRNVLRTGVLRVRARFQGNQALAPKTSRTRSVRAG